MGEPLSAAGLPPLVEPGPQLSPEQLRRYARNLRVPQIGELGQRRLRAATVLCVGAGALGSPALLYLAAAGVGTLAIVDDDDVELSNLQRQVIHGCEAVGRAKTASAAARIRELNPDVQVVEHRRRLDAGSALELVSGCDLVLDGSDNFATRYLVSDACEITGIPHVWASILRFDGQASVFWAQHGPTYRDLHPVPPQPGSVPSCAEAGVLGALPGMLGSTLAMEAMKLIMGTGAPLLGRLSICDALDGSWTQIPLRRAAGAVAVTRMSPFDDPARDGYPGAEDSAGILAGASGASGASGGGASCVASEPGPPSSDPTASDPELVTPEQLSDLLAERAAGRASFELIDVREPWEHRLERIDGARLVPLGEFTAQPAPHGPDSARSGPDRPDRERAGTPRSGQDEGAGRSGSAASRLDGAADVILYCQAGVRSAQALSRLRAADSAAGRRRRLRHLDGGLSSWSQEGLPTIGD